MRILRSAVFRAVADAVVRYVLKTKPDTVPAESHRHGKLARWFMTHTDRELIRTCPCPLSLVKTTNLAGKQRVLAAIDPFHSRSKPAALDAEILRVGRMTAGDNGRLGATHVLPIAGGSHSSPADRSHASDVGRSAGEAIRGNRQDYRGRLD